MKNAITLFSFLFYCICSGAQTLSYPVIVDDPANQSFGFAGNDRCYDLGGMQANSISACQFEFKNTGCTPIIISEVYALPDNAYGSKGKLLFGWPGKPVKPGKKGIIKATFLSQGDMGSFKYEVHILSNVTTSGHSVMYISGAVMPPMKVHDSRMKEPVIPIEILAPMIRNNTR